MANKCPHCKKEVDTLIESLSCSEINRLYKDGDRKNLETEYGDSGDTYHCPECNKKIHLYDPVTWLNGKDELKETEWEDLPQHIVNEIDRLQREDILERYDVGEYHDQDIIHNVLADHGYKLYDEAKQKQNG